MSLLTFQEAAVDPIVGHLAAGEIWRCDCCRLS